MTSLLGRKFQKLIFKYFVEWRISQLTNFACVESNIGVLEPRWYNQHECRQICSSLHSPLLFAWFHIAVSLDITWFFLFFIFLFFCLLSMVGWHVGGGTLTLQDSMGMCPPFSRFFFSLWRPTTSSPSSAPETLSHIFRKVCHFQTQFSAIWLNLSSNFSKYLFPRPQFQVI